MLRHIVCLIILFLFFQLQLLPQTRLELEQYFETISTDEEATFLLEKLDYFIDNPVNLYYATTAQIAEIPGILYIDAYLIHEMFRKKDKKYTIDSIAVYLNLNEYQIYILKVCTIIEVEKVKTFSGSIRERTSYQIETPVGYEKEKYLGDKWNLYQRYQASYGEYRGGLTLNKNSGEQHLAEFYSGFLEYDSEKIKVILGDFAVSTGMGNLWGDAFSLGKSVNVIDLAMNYGSKLSPYVSKMDYRTLRGVATRLDIPIKERLNIVSTLWYSNIFRSGNIKDDFISSLYTAGTYRTETEISKKNAVREQIAGATIELNGCSYSCGINVSYIDYDKEIKSTSSRVFSGKAGFLSSIFSTFHLGALQTSGELSIDNRSNIGLKLGSIFRSPNFDFSLHFRSFEESFRSPFGSIFGEFSYPANELGMYVGFLWKGVDRIKVKAYFDWFYSYAPTYTIDTNVTGFAIFTQADAILSKEASCYGRLYLKNKTNQKKDKKVTTFFQGEKYGARLEYSYDFSKKINVRSRAELVYLDNKNVFDNEFGAAFFVEGTWKVAKFLRLQARGSYFSTDSYASAIWQYEYYYPGASYSPALYEEGTRAYIALQIMPIDCLKLYLRYVNYYKFDVESIGSSYEKINSNQQNRFYLQIDFKF